MGSIDGEIPAVWFLISSIGFIILTVIQYRNTGKIFIYYGNHIFLSVNKKLLPYSQKISLEKQVSDTLLNDLLM